MRETKKKPVNYNLSSKTAHQVGTPRKLFRGKYSKTLSSLKNSLPINHSLSKIPILSIVSLSHTNALPNVNKNIPKWLFSASSTFPLVRWILRIQPENFIRIWNFQMLSFHCNSNFPILCAYFNQYFNTYIMFERVHHFFDFLPEDNDSFSCTFKVSTITLVIWVMGFISFLTE